MITDFADVVASCSVPITVTRFLPAVVEDGRKQGPQPESTIEMMASVQPMSQKDLERLPEGLRARGAVKVYSSTELRTVQTSECRQPDRFFYGGVTYQIESVDNWFDFGGYYKAIATRVTR